MGGFSWFSSDFFFFLTRREEEKLTKMRFPFLMCYTILDIDSSTSSVFNFYHPTFLFIYTHTNHSAIHPAFWPHGTLFKLNTLRAHGGFM